MTRRTGWILFAIGLIVAIAAGVGVFYVVQRQADAARDAVIAARAAAPQKPTITIPVARGPLLQGASLTAPSIDAREFPLELVPARVITDATRLNERILLRPVGQGEWFTDDMLFGTPGDAATTQLAKGDVVFAFPVNDLLTQSNQIRDGDRLDLLLTLQLQDPTGQLTGKSTAMTLQNIAVLKVVRAAAENPNEGKPASLMLSMSRENAVIVKFVKDSGGVIDFVLRTPIDTEIFQVPAINQDEIVKRYGFK